MDNDNQKTYSRVDRRNAVLNACATRLMNDKDATWNNFTTLFTNGVYPDTVTDADLTEQKVRQVLKEILVQAFDNLERGKKRGPADNLIQIGIKMPRQKKGK